MVRRLIGGEFESRANTPGRGVLEDYLSAGLCFSLWGGAASVLRVIIKAMKLEPGDVVLFPSYLCPSILIPFRQAGLLPRFYKVGGDLVIDIGDLESRLQSQERVKAVFFIHYFGFLQPPRVLCHLRAVGNRGFFIIEDGVQSLFSKGVFSTGDWGVASLRKWLYIDAGVLAGMTRPVGVHPRRGYNFYKFYKDLGIWAREKYLQGGAGFFEKIYLNMLNKARKCYSKDTKIRKLSLPDSFRLKRGIGYTDLIAKRRENFMQLSRALEENDNLVPLFTLNDPDLCPLGFPVRVNAEIREELLRHLAAKNIFCPVHWDLKGNVPDDYSESLKLSREILTIPVDQRYGHVDMDYISGCVEQFFESRRG